MIDYIKSNALLKSVVTLMFVAGFIYMTVTEIEIPEYFTSITTLIVTFYFSTDTPQQTAQAFRG